MSTESNIILLNFDQFEPSTRLDIKLYRYLRIDDFLLTLKEKRIVLRKPHLWKDPFENIFMQTEVVDTNGNPQDFSLSKEQIYAQCWTLKEESDLMWKSYVDDYFGVKVSTTIRQIDEVTSKIKFVFLGKVNYFTEDEIVKSFSQPIQFSVTEDVIFSKSLLVKREAFEEEREVRLIFFDQYRNQEKYGPHIFVMNWDKNDYKDESVNLPLSPNTFFNEVIVDPRLGPQEVDSMIMKIKEYGYTGIVKRSTLYDFPKIKIVINMKSHLDNT